VVIAHPVLCSFDGIFGIGIRMIRINMSESVGIVATTRIVR
jgi:hypothetical protein